MLGPDDAERVQGREHGCGRFLCWCDTLSSLVSLHQSQKIEAAAAPKIGDVGNEWRIRSHCDSGECLDVVHSPDVDMVVLALRASGSIHGHWFVKKLRLP